MSQTIAGAVAALQAKAAALSGIAYAPDNPAETSVQLPFAFSYPESQQYDGGYAGYARTLVTIITELHFSRQDLAIGVSQATPYGDSFPAALVADPTLAAAVQATVFPMTAEFGLLRWGSDAEAHIGWKFHTTVKLENAV